MRADRTIQITVSDPVLQVAMSKLLGSLLASTGTGANSDLEPDLTAKIRAEAADLPNLAEALMQQLVGIATDFDAAAVSVTIEGIRPIDDGMRAWGIVGLSSEAAGPEISISMLRTPDVRQEQGNWVIQTDLTIN